MQRSTLLASVVAGLVLSSPLTAGEGCSSTCSSEPAANTARTATLASYTAPAAQDIVDTAVNAGSFETLVAAVKAADLVGALKGDGPFTVFAPTDHAFAKLPKGTLETLLKPKNKALLTSILTYHVVPGRLTAKDVVAKTRLTSLNGQRIDVTTKGDAVMLDGAKVVTANIETSNGIIHVIDTVILPSSDDIVATATKAGSFGTLATALKSAGLLETMRTGGPFTVLAPTDAAFAKLPAGTIDSLLEPKNRSKLQAILKYHVIPGRVYADDALRAQTAKTLNGQRVSFSVRGGSITVGDANVVQANIDTSNGVIHVIDEVLLPE